ncbi:NADP-dependent oxidoreductase [Microbacterium lacus]|uniref:NADP-dependent oxidoreductase n=1 Tax=Microbacterium lacus TaxID=415217 RepID=UPI00384A8E57
MAQRWVARAWGGTENWDLEEFEVADPGAGEVTIRIVAAGLNPADLKHLSAPRTGVNLPVPIGYEVSGVLSAIGPDTLIGSGTAAVGDEVLAFRVQGGYATHLTVPAKHVFAKPASLPHEEAANLLLAGATASQMLDVTSVAAGETIVLHGASGAVGVAVLQLARHLDVRVIGTASEASFDRVREFGGIPVTYGPGVMDRVREAAGTDVAASLDAVGTGEAIDASLALVKDRARIVTIVSPARAKADGFVWIAGAQPESTVYRDAVRQSLIGLAGAGALRVPIARTYPLADARDAVAFLMRGHPGGKIALLP